jgi:hypothetical protein
MTQLTIAVPDELASRLAPYEEQLPQIIARGLERIEGTQGVQYADLRDVLKKLATLPSPDEVVALRPSAALQARVAELLEKQRHARLSDEEEREFADVEYIEHVVRMAKGRARHLLFRP